ncbi:MAG TPA: efflux RND transporter periplasmic adaptor subunit [Flavitalea sp.]|nr:efflux RND transporter periplasmic adaptor subunit [Flavitalea sp.]
MYKYNPEYMFPKSIIFASATLTLLISSCGNSGAPAGPPALPPAKVLTQAVQIFPAVYYETYPATITPLNEIELRPQVSGYITGIHFRDGDRVRKGELLYSIDPQLYTANYQQAVANLSVQEANLVKAQKDADRYHALEKNDAVAKQLVDNADAALEVAKKQAEAAKANISGTQTSVRYTKVYAPFNGIIGISLVKPGAAVSAGATLLNTVSTDKELAVDFNIDQREIYRFNKLINDKPSLKDSTFTLSFGGEVYSHPGKIAFLDRSVNVQTGSIKARLIFPNEKNMLRAGMNTTVRVKTSAPDSTILVPYKAVTEQLGEFFVYVPGDSSKVSQRKVSLGTQIGNNIIVSQGLAPGDSVVVEGVQNLREGMVIQSVPATPSAAEQTKNK